MIKEILGIKVPTNDTILSRTSTIAKSLATSIIPRIDPSKEEIDKVTSFFMVDKEMKCAYCSKPADEWDHFHALINDSGPSGYITELYNLVPCCKNCNQAKGGKKWRDFLYSSSPESPLGRGISIDTIQTNEKNLEQYDELPKTKIEFEDIPGFKDFWNCYSEICDKLKAAQTKAEDFNFKENIFQKIDNHTLNFDFNGKKTSSQLEVVKIYISSLLKSKDKIENINQKFQEWLNTSKTIISEGETLEKKEYVKWQFNKKKYYYIFNFNNLRQEDFAKLVNAINNDFKINNKRSKIDLC